MNIQYTTNYDYMFDGLKEIPFGYRKFDHFLAKIFLIKGIIKE